MRNVFRVLPRLIGRCLCVSPRVTEIQELHTTAVMCVTHARASHHEVVLLAGLHLRQRRLSRASG